MFNQLLNVTPPVYWEEEKDTSATIGAFIILAIIFIACFLIVYCTISCATSTKKKVDNHGFFMKALIKAILIVAIACFALCNYRLLSFSKGFSKFELDCSNAEEAITALVSINKIEYYDVPLPNEQPYIIFVETADNNYLFRIDSDGISALSAAGLFAKNVRPQKISPVPFWIEIIIALVIIFIPFGRRKRIEDETPTAEETVIDNKQVNQTTTSPARAVRKSKNESHVTDSILEEFLDFAKSYDTVERVVLFGSRARDDYGKNSDYDIAIYGNLTARERTEFRCLCSEELNMIDLVFMCKDNGNKFTKNIETEGIVLYNKVSA